MNIALLEKFSKTAWSGINNKVVRATVRPKRGFEIVLSRIDDQITLRATHKGYILSSDDAATIAQAFHVPDGIEPKRWCVKNDEIVSWSWKK